jgi:hypothetical protein
VVEHVFGRFAEVYDPLGEVRRLDAVRHVLRVNRASGVIVATDAADPAGDEVRVRRALAFHEDGVATKYGRRAPAISNDVATEVHLGVNAQASDDARNRVP